MRFRRFKTPYSRDDFEPIERRWFSIGWHPIDDVEQMNVIAGAWKAKFGTRYGIWGADPVIPPPLRSWDITALYPLTAKTEEIEAEFTLKMLAAFRRCVPKGERLLVIGHWQLAWYEFDPHGGVTAATLYEWARPILPGEVAHFLSRDLRFGTYGDWRGGITIFGRELFAALELDPPGEFFKVCRPLRRRASGAVSMSDNWIAIIPEDPRFVPDAAKQRRARDRFAEIAPEADEIEIKVSERVEYFDCGTNLERILCPSCGSQVPFAWWEDRLEEDDSDGFKLAEYATPCCGARRTLHALAYEWPQGFGCFAIDAMNPNIGKLEDRYKEELEAILGTRLRVIYRHL